MLVQYVRHNDKMVGCVVALNEDLVGWSQCNKKDTFNKKRGMEIAIGRALNGSKKKPAKTAKEYLLGENGKLYRCIYSPIDGVLARMSDRAKKYFKNKNVQTTEQPTQQS